MPELLWNLRERPAHSIISIIPESWSNGYIFRLWKTRYSCHFGCYKNTIEKLKKTFLQKVRRPPDHNEAINIKNRFVSGIEKCYFLFLEREDVELTNNLSEQAIRFVVIDKPITQGARSWSGMRFCERALLYAMRWAIYAASATMNRISETANHPLNT